MKFKSLILSALCLSAAAFTSCDGAKDAPYSPAAPVDTPDAYFNVGESGAKFEVGETDTEVSITLYRPGTEGTETVAISLEDANGKFTAPASVTFAAGENTVQVPISFDPTTFEGLKEYKVSVKVGDGANTPYFLQTAEVIVIFVPWNDVVGANGETMGTWVDDLVSTWYGIPNLTWQVKIQSSPAIDGLYRVVNPYQWYYQNVSGLAGYDSSTDHYLYFNASNPKRVFFCNAKGDAVEADGSMVIFTSGLSIAGDGFWQIAGRYNLQVANGANGDKYLGAMTDGVVTFPEQSILIGESEYNGGLAALAGGYANKKGEFRIMLPGCKEPEPEPDPEQPTSEWVSIGACSYTDPYIYPLFGVAAPQTYDVEVEKNTKTPGVFRMVNPYKEGVMPDGQDYDGDLYIEIDCTNPDLVVIPLQNTGFADQTDGDTYVCNMGYAYQQFAGYTPEQIIANGLNDVYTASNYTINLPTAHGMFNFPHSDNADDLYTANNKIDGSLVMNGQAAAQAKMSMAQVLTTPQYFGKLLKKAGFNTLNRKPVRMSNRAIKTMVK